MSAPVDVLAQCPFCGYDDIRRDDQAAPDNNGIVYCDQCGAEALSADAWNMRTHSAAVAELIERDKAATQLFDCILRGLNDLTGSMGHRSEQFVAGWLENWATSMHAAGFKPTNPGAPDIARSLARIGCVA